MPTILNKTPILRVKISDFEFTTKWGMSSSDEVFFNGLRKDTRPEGENTHGLLLSEVWAQLSSPGIRDMLLIVLFGLKSNWKMAYRLGRN
jgi:hypothetical protein